MGRTDAVGGGDGKTDPRSEGKEERGTDESAEHAQHQNTGSLGEVINGDDTALDGAGDTSTVERG